MDIQNDPGGISFIIPRLSQFSSQEMLGSLRMLSLRGEIRLETVFEEEYVDIPISVIVIDQVLIPDFVQNTTDQDNVGEPPIQEVLPKEQTLPPQ